MWGTANTISHSWGKAKKKKAVPLSQRLKCMFSPKATAEQGMAKGHILTMKLECCLQNFCGFEAENCSGASLNEFKGRRHYPDCRFCCFLYRI